MSELGGAGLRGKRVLIVEDEGVTQFQLQRSLHEAGITIVGAAKDGETGVRLAQELSPDLILMDINLPGMDGLEATERILEQQETCVVMFTAFGLSELQERASKAGVCGYITKPISVETLLPELENAWQLFVSRDGKHA